MRHRLEISEALKNDVTCEEQARALADAALDSDSESSSCDVADDELSGMFEAQERQDIDPGSMLHEKTKKLRDRVWGMWLEFAARSRFDAETLWVDLRRGQDLAKRRCLVFLRYYTRKSTKRRPVLGKCETEKVRTVNCAVTLEDVWSALVQVADVKVMQPRRDADPEKAEFWMLKRRRGGGHIEPADAIAKIIPKLAQDLGLSLEQTFEKKEMTSEDVLAILDTLWTRADGIICSPKQRVAFHSAVVLGGLGGWRPASLLGIKYKDVEIGWLRDPRDMSRTWPVASITIHHVKTGENRIRRNQKHKLKFTVTLADYAPLCLLRFLLCRVVSDQAFKAGFCKVEEITQAKPLDDGIDYTPLSWSEDMLEKEIIDLKYHTFWKIWNRCMLVAGLLDKPRPYSMRVGAGGRLDGSLTDAMRNFILSNSTEVFETSYQPVDLRDNLMKISFGTRAGNTDALIAKRHQAFTQRDPNAPIYITHQDLELFNERNDICALKARRKRVSLEEGPQCQEVKQINGQIAHILGTLEEQRILERRREFFQKANELRAQGLPTTHLHDDTSNPRPKLYEKYSPPSVAIGQSLFSPPACSKSFDLVAMFLTGHLEVTSESRTKQGTRCFLCFRNFSNKSGLTRHVSQTHKKTFDRPFDCPECQRRGLKAQRIANRIAWSAHTSKFHGAINTPTPGTTSSSHEVYCLLCMKAFRSSGFNLHFQRTHVKLGQFERAFACPVDGTVIANLDAWIGHVRMHHHGGKIKGSGVKP